MKTETNGETDIIHRIQHFVSGKFGETGIREKMSDFVSSGSEEF
jgi:hypothetical protein